MKIFPSSPLLLEPKYPLIKFGQKIQSTLLLEPPLALEEYRVTTKLSFLQKNKSGHANALALLRTFVNQHKPQVNLVIYF